MNIVPALDFTDNQPVKTTHRFPIGTQYMSRGKYPRLCTVVDQLTTTNSKGEVVSVRYLTSHDFCGQTVTEMDVVDTTIARGLLASAKE